MESKQIGVINTVLLGLTMLVSGLIKLFMMGPGTGVKTFFSGLTFFGIAGLSLPAPLFFAWLVTIAEIVFGIAILARWRLSQTVWPPIVILLVATFTAHWTNWGNMLVHLTLASNYWLLGAHSANRKADK